MALTASHLLKRALSGFAYCSEEPWVRCLNRTRTQAAKDWSGKVGIRASGSGQTNQSLNFKLGGGVAQKM